MVVVIKKLIANRLFYNTFLMLAAGSIVNAGNYAYHLLMGRFLGPSQYGVLASLVAILYLIAIPAGTLNLIVTKMTAQFKGRKEYGKVSRLFLVLTRWVVITSIFIFFLFLIGSPFIASFLNISQTSSVITLGAIFGFFFLIALNRSIIQGLQKFEFFSLTNVFEIICKLSFGIFLVRIGFGVTGAILAILITEALVYFATLWPLKFNWLTAPNALRIGKKVFLKNSWQPLFIFLSLTSLFSMDIILVKHFLPAYEAGLYAALAVMGKVIFLASSTVVLVMYPMITEAHEKQEGYQHILYPSIILVLLASFILTIAYYFYPKIWIDLFFGKDYYGIAPHLGPFAVFISLYSVINLFVNFFFAVTQVTFMPFLILAAVAQILFISIFHQSIEQIIMVSIYISSLLLISLILIFIKRMMNYSYERNSSKC